MNILISGFTGSGKSEISKSLARQLKWQLISGAKIRQAALQISAENIDSEFWRFSQTSVDLDQRRIATPDDGKAVDDLLLDTIANSSECVFDVWFAAWLIPQSSAICIWLDAPLDHRARRLALPTRREIRDLARIIDGKDERAAEFARKAYGIEMRSDRKPFDVLIDTTTSSVDQIVRLICHLIGQLNGQMGASRAIPQINIPGVRFSQSLLERLSG